MGYYESCAVPKPGTAKKKKIYNGYKDKPNRVCAYCGKPYAERHEVFCGANRQISIKNGYQIDVCQDHHRELQENITEWAQSENLRLKRHYQKEYIRKCTDAGYKKKEAETLWRNLIGKIY